MSTIRKSNTSTRKNIGKSVSRRKTLTLNPLSLRQLGSILNNTDNYVKKNMTKDDYEKYIEKLEKWILKKTTEEECDVANFMNDEENSLGYTKELAEELVGMEKNKSVPEIIKPNEGCKRVVFGLSKDLYRYFEHNNVIKKDFILLSVDNWTPEKNIEFLSCAIKNNFEKKCNSQIAILFPKDLKELMKTEGERIVPKITAHENQFFYYILLNSNIQKRGNGILPLDENNFTYDILFINTIEEETSSAGGKSRKRKHKRKARTIKKRYR
jgi:hypothetical protein